MVVICLSFRELGRIDSCSIPLVLVLVLRGLLVLFVSTFYLLFSGLYRIVSSSILLVLVLVLSGLLILFVSTFYLIFRKQARNFRETTGGGLLVLVVVDSSLLRSRQGRDNLLALVFSDLVASIFGEQARNFRKTNGDNLLVLDKNVQEKKRKDDAIDEKGLKPSESPVVAESLGSLLLPRPRQPPLQ